MTFCVRSLRSLTTASLLILAGTTGVAYATGSLTFDGHIQTLNTGGSITLSQPYGIVVDSLGNRFISDTLNNRIVKVDAWGNASVLTISGLSPALSTPGQIAVDGTNNLYVADVGNSRVVKVDSTGAGSVISTGSVTLAAVFGVAVDPSGNIFIADGVNNQIVEVTAGGSAAALVITVSSGSSTFNHPLGLAVDTSGNLYIADNSNGRIVTVASGSTTGVVRNFTGLSPALPNPTGVAVDRIGNVYVAAGNRVIASDTAGNGYDLMTASSYLQGTTLTGPKAIAIDNSGTAYVADTGGNRVLALNPYLNGDPTAGAAYSTSLNKTAVGFGHITLGSLSPASLTLNFTVGAPVSGLGDVKVFTSGTANLDFQIVTGSNTTCSSSTGLGTCTVEVSFQPTAPGVRRGALVLYDSTEVPILTLPLYGFADASVSALAPITGTVISTGGVTLSNPYQVALDGAGNMYVGNYTGKKVVKIPAGGGTATTLDFSPLTLQDITGVAVDGAGNLFVGDHQNSRILVMTPAGDISVLSISGLSPALGFPTAMAFDGAGNLFVGDFTNGRVVELSSLNVLGATSSGIGTVLGTGSYSFSTGTLTGLGVGPDGTVYIAARTQNSSHIIQVTAAGAASALNPTGITFSNPQGVMVDGMGNIYVNDTGSAGSRVTRMTTAGVTTEIKLSVTPAISTLIFEPTVDNSGNLYIPDWNNNRIIFGNVSGASLTFPTATNVGSTDTTDGAKTATVTNLGNLPLLFSADPTYTTSFTSNSSDTNLCTATTSLAAGTLCDVSVNFVPQTAGSLSAGITVTNNSWNVPSSTQQVSVSGTGLLATPPPPPPTPSLSSSSSTVTFGSQLVGTTSGGQTITLTNTYSSAETLNSISLSSTLDFMISGTTCGSTLAAGQSCTITVKALPQATGSRTATLNVVHTDPSASAATTAQIALTVPATQANTAGLTFVPITPCRISDTRNATGAFGGPSLTAASSRDFAIQASACGIPATAKAYSLNVTAVPTGVLGFLSVWPAGQSRPTVSTLNSDGRVKANAAIVAAGANGAVSVFASDATNVILDINGYFVTPSSTPSLAFYPLAPCRVADTRNATGQFGGPYLTGGAARTFPVLTSTCNVPATAQAYSVNLTAIPRTTLRYLAAYPTGQGQTGTSTLNSPMNTVTANAAIVAAGTNGGIDVFATDNTDLVIDINGYFAPLTNTGLGLYTTTQCRLTDTRNSTALTGTLAVNALTGTCSAPVTASVLVLNATVVPKNNLGFLAIWPDGTTRPNVSTLNSSAGATASNMAIVPTTNGSVDVFSSDQTQVILDLSGYFGVLNILQ